MQLPYLHPSAVAEARRLRACRVALVVVFSVALLVAVLVSELARRSVLSTAVLILAVGFLATALGWVSVPDSSPLLEAGAEIALVATLFTDGLKLDLGELRSHWRLATRALVVGLPLTFISTALLARWMLELEWTRSLLVGAALAPTDPVFASSLIGSERVPVRLRRLLNIESGLNDGLTVPAVVYLMGALTGASAAIHLELLDVLLGLGIGALVPLPAIWLVRRHPFGATKPYQPLLATAILLVAASGARALGWNELLAAFAAGVVLGTISEDARRHYHELGENVTELLKLAALLVFAASIQPHVFAEVGWRGYVFVLATLLVPRPLALLCALARSDLNREGRLAAAWIGPKGFASMLFGLLILHSSIPDRRELFHYIALVVVASIVVHSSTDHLVEQRFERAERAENEPVAAR